jgi:hypothetical protein
MVVAGAGTLRVRGKSHMQVKKISAKRTLLPLAGIALRSKAISNLPPDHLYEFPSTLQAALSYLPE